VTDTAGADTRAVLNSVFEAWERRDAGPFVAALADDLSFTVTGTSPIAGSYTGRDAYVAGVLDPIIERLDGMTSLRLVRLVVDGEWAATHLRGRGTGKRGEDYNMDYCWMVRVVDRKIAEVVGFYDSVKVNALFG
jgi:uncharacterized protein